MFTDIHSHILPGVDDGCKDLAEARKLLKSCIDNKVENIICTPHFNCENDPLKKPELMDSVRGLKEQVMKEGMDINIFPGMEVRASRRIMEFAEDKDYLVTMNGKKKYLLLELPFSHEPYKLPDLLFQIKLLKIIPILSHPERYDYLSGRTKYLEKLHDEGLLMQVNNSSLVKGWTSPVYRRAVSMLKAGIIDFIASDCHYMKGRFSNFIPAYEKLTKILGRKQADLIALENPGRLLLGQDIV
jgi:protein-tyrosine phosphatase